MKKFICGAVAACMSMTSAYAAELKAEYNPKSGLYEISGCAPESDYNGLVSITVSKGDIMGWASTLYTDANGNFSDSFAFESDAEGGYYTVNVGAYEDGVIATTTLLYVTDEQKKTALKAINTAEDRNALNKAILDNALYLGIDEDLYDSIGSVKNDVLDIILEKDDYTDIDEFLLDFKTAIAYALIKNADEESIVEIMEQYALYFDLSSSELYDEFLKLDKNDVYAKMAGADCETTEEVMNLFEEAVSLTIINNTVKWNDFKTALDSYIGYLDIDTEYYDKCNKSELASAICDEEYNSAEEIYDAVKKYYNKVKKDSGNSSGSSSGVSGGKGGSTVSYTNPLLPTENKTENLVIYSDMSEYEWASEAVLALSKRGVISGDGKGNFNPGDNITREQFVKMLLLAFDVYSDGENSSFVDVDVNNWAYPYISSAVASGVVNGISADEFGYGLPVTRQDVAVLIYRVAKIANTDFAKLNPVEFNDMERISDYAKESVIAMVEAGIINGYDDGCFKPDNPASRAEAAIMLYRALNK